MTVLYYNKTKHKIKVGNKHKMIGSWGDKMKRKITFLLSVLYIISCIVMPASATTLDNAKKQQQNVKSQISKIAGAKKEVTDKIKQSTEDKLYYDNLTQKEQGNLKNKSKEVTNLEAEVERLAKEIDSINENYENKNELFKKRMRVMYQNMDKSSLELFVESKNLSEFLSRLQLLSLVQKNDEKLIRDIAYSKTSTDMAKQGKLADLDKKLTQLKNLNVKVSDLKISRAKAESEIEASKSRLKELEKKEDEMISLSKQLEKTIANLMDSKAKYAGGIMKWPTPGYIRISSPFGYRIHPVYKVRKLHTGIDIDAPMGAKIVAANSGKVILAGWNGGYGNCIIIDHGGGLATLYGHQSKLLVSVGDRVDKGDTIGKVGSTGVSTGPHLHFEVRKKGTPVNPRDYV